MMKDGEKSKIGVKKPKTWAAGVPAVTNSMKHVMSSAGPIRGTKALLDLNQYDGFDCPSCAWPDPDDHRAVSEFCENGAKAIASEATSKVVTDEFFRKYSVADLLEKSDYWHDQQGRLTAPMVKLPDNDHYQAISWDDAFDLLGSELKNLDSPDDSIFYTSGRASNEAAFLYQLFVRHFGTNNLPDCSNMCHESSGSALGYSIGIGKGTVSLDDIHNSDCIICIGQNPGTNHPRMLSSLEKAVENGATVVSINPLKEAGLLAFAHPQKVTGMMNIATNLTSQYLQVKANGDMAIFRAIGKYIFENDSEQNPIIDKAFISEHTAGLEDYRKVCEESTWEEILEMSGIAKEELIKLAETVVAKQKRLITCWAMGITQQRNAVAIIKEITNIHLLIGAIGREGAGVCPVRGHSNVQGDRTMGIYEKASDSFLDRLDTAFDFKSPRPHGYDVVESIHAMHKEKGKIFMALGGNFLQAAPDTEYTAEALKNCRITCHIATKLNRSHLVTGEIGLIFPCLGRTDKDIQEDKQNQFITCENSMGIVHMSTGKLTPPSELLLSEPMIIARLADKVVGNTSKVNWLSWAGQYDRIRDAIEASIEHFEDFNNKVRNYGGFYLYNSAKELNWETHNGKANFGADILDTFALSNPENLVMQTLRSHDQYNTTIYGLDDRYRGISSERMIIFMNPKDMQKRGIKPTQKTVIKSYWNDEVRELSGFHAIPYDMPRGCSATYYPEANPLVPIGSTAIESNTPTSKAIEISVTPM